MISWRDFDEKASRRRGWEVRAGIANYRDPRGRYTAEVMIVVPKNTLSPSQLRLKLSSSGLWVDYEVRTHNGEAYNDLDDIRSFSSEWTSLWMARCGCSVKDAQRRTPKFNLAPPIPEGFEPPASLPFPPHMTEAFSNYGVSETPLAQLWGQSSSRLDGVEGEVEVRGWDEKPCPFCGQTFEDGETLNLQRLRPSDVKYFGLEARVVCCPGCDRILDVAA